MNITNYTGGRCNSKIVMDYEYTPLWPVYSLPVTDTGIARKLLKDGIPVVLALLLPMLLLFL